MPIRLEEENGGKILIIHVTGKLVKEDYAKLGIEFGRLVWLYGTIRLMFDMMDFHGWEACAAWEDFKLGVTHFGDIERLAMVGETRWQEGMATFCKPFTTATIRYFDHLQGNEARDWLREPE